MKRKTGYAVALTALALVVLALSVPGAASSDPSLQVATVTPTPDPYEPYTVTALASRTYGEGQIEVVEPMTGGAGFSRYLIKYPSDGLDIYGFLNVPQNVAGPLPVIIAIHGYIDPAAYGTLDYTTRYADDFARAGFVVLHPNLRGYWPSDGGPDLFRTGMAADVLNLVALVRAQGGQPGPLAMANADAIGLWGHSMGGGVSLRVITVDPDIDAAVLYGAMSGDERQNYTKIMEWSDGQRGRTELLAPDSALARINPLNHLDRIQAAVSVHHGQSDEQVPVAWSVDLCQRLLALNKAPECFLYENQPHTFWGELDRQFVQRAIAFFRLHLG